MAMTADSSRRVARGVWTVLSGFVVESLVFALAVLPAALFWAWHFRLSLPVNWLRTLVLTLAFVPAYLLFSFGLIVFSALVTRPLGWRTPARMEMRIADMG